MLLVLIIRVPFPSSEFWEITQAVVMFTVAVAGVTLWLWRRCRARKAQKWPYTEGTIESGGFEVVSHSKYGDITLPVLAFSYQVKNEYFGGRFALLPYITDPGASVVDRMIKRKIRIHYDPIQPQTWFIADEFIEGCRIEQELSPDFVNYKPRNDSSTRPG